jgi:hypothetical protein
VHYARENGELELWRESFKINKECRKYINEKASVSYHDQALPDFIKELTDTFGLERSIYVMARFVVAAEWDKRYDTVVKERASKVDFQDLKEAEKQIAEGHSPHDVHILGEQSTALSIKREFEKKTKQKTKQTRVIG